jgi:hypothetical protein
MFSDLENVTDFLFLSKRILLYSLSGCFLKSNENPHQTKPISNSIDGPLLLKSQQPPSSHHLALLIFSTEDLATKSNQPKTLPPWCFILLQRNSFSWVSFLLDLTRDASRELVQKPIFDVSMDTMVSVQRLAPPFSGTCRQQQSQRLGFTDQTQPT